MRYSEATSNYVKKTQKSPGFLRSRWLAIPQWLRFQIFLFGIPLLLAGLTFGYAFFVEPWMITVAKYEIESDRLPAAFDGVKIALIADPHHGKPHTYDKLRRTVRKTLAQSPDLILLGGDYARERPEALAECFAGLSELDAPLGVYAVLGNHDNWDPPFIRQTIADSNIPLLENSAVWIEKDGSKILLAGVDDFWCGKPSLEPMWEEIVESDYTVLLSHNPDFIKTVEPLLLERIDLMLSGHTHGGQVTAFGLFSPVATVKSGYDSGHFPPTDKGEPHVIVSNGLGTSALPLRFCAKPQIVIVTLKKSK